MLVSTGFVLENATSGDWNAHDQTLLVTCKCFSLKQITVLIIIFQNMLPYLELKLCDIKYLI